MAKLRKSPFFSKECFSKANAEKVVKPPQNPVARNKVLLEEITLPLAVNPKKRPISRQPITLTRNVPKKKL